MNLPHADIMELPCKTHPTHPPSLIVDSFVDAIKFRREMLFFRMKWCFLSLMMLYATDLSSTCNKRTSPGPPNTMVPSSQG
jgi:hypothetical protein